MKSYYLNRPSKIAAVLVIVGIWSGSAYSANFEWVPETGNATGLLVLADGDATVGSHTAVPLSATFDPDGPGASSALSPIIGFYAGMFLNFGFQVAPDGVLQEGINSWANNSVFESHMAAAGETTQTPSGVGRWLKTATTVTVTTPDAGSTVLLLATALGSLGVARRKE
jgi:hypothetical protein